MKELSIEEKAKRYDEAKARMSKAFNSNRCTIGFMNEIFPELKESDDERIRRWIINYLDNKALNSGIIQEKTNIKNAIAYLEKQGEQKPADKVEPKFKVGDTIQPKDPVLSEPRIIERIYPTWGYDTNKGILDFEFEDNWELVEQKPAWSEEDERMKNQLVDFMLSGIDISKAPYGCVAWLKSLKEKVIPQPKQEWSEEDEDILNTIINHFEIDLECTENDDIIRWLKFLKDRVLSQNTWKPSDEQIRMIEKVVNGQVLFDNQYESLKELLEQLKAL